MTHRVELGKLTRAGVNEVEATGASSGQGEGAGADKKREGNKEEVGE